MVATGNRVWANVRKNESTRIPRRHVFIDTESRFAREGQASVQTWRLGVACMSIMYKGRGFTERWGAYADPKDMWNDIVNFADTSGRTVVWAHNLAYDVRISGALEILPAMGFELVAHNVTSRNTWLRWQRDGRTILMVDSKSVFPTTLAKVGEYVGLGKMYMDIDDDSNERWFNRCRRDVEILREAVCRYLKWIEEEDCGNWQVTGAGQAWSLYRHKFLTVKLVTHDDEDALVAERRAMWAGRCEAYWKGEINATTVHEWDFTQAYARIARDNPVPVRLLGLMPRGHDWQKYLDSKNVGILADITVTTAAPVLPAECDGRILWPVGTFRTVVWDPEIKAAIDAGASVRINKAWLYRTRPALQAWGKWILQQLNADETDCPTLIKLVLKHHSRALIGRMAMTYNDWEEYIHTERPAVCRGREWNRDENRIYETLQVGTTVWRDNGRVEWSGSLPMVTGYVQSIARVMLWKLIDALPEGVALYCDTDSVLATQSSIGTVDKVARDLFNGALRLKRSWDGIAIYGPRQVVTGSRVRVSGVPISANRVDRGKYVGEVWDRISTSIGRGSPSEVLVRSREWSLHGVDRRRVGTAPGWTKPVKVKLNGQNDSNVQA